MAPLGVSPPASTASTLSHGDRFSNRRHLRPSTLTNMVRSSRKKLPPSNGLASQSTQQPRPVCTWSSHSLQPGPSPSPFPRYSHTLTATATATGELFLFGGDVHGFASNDLYLFSARDFSTTLLQTSGEVPRPRVAHAAALTSSSVLIWGGITNFSNQNVLNQRHDDSLYLLSLGTSYLLMSR